MANETLTRLDPGRPGRQHEVQACRYLQKQGLTLLCRNYLCRLGEIDLVMTERDQFLVFIEIRFRQSDQFGGAIASVTHHKQRKVRLAAAHFLAAHPQLSHYACRFDVVGVSRSGNSNVSKFDWIQQAFT